MIIDFHTHVFPDKIACKALNSLSAACGGIYKPVSDGTVRGLVSRMDEWHIDVSVIQPVVTKGSQLPHANEWAAAAASGRIAAFGGIYPHSENWKQEIDRIASLGLKGIKFHPEYQQFAVDAPKMLRMYDYALAKNLILLFHAGADPAFPPPYHSSPAQFAHIVDEMRGGVIVAAHLGGHKQWDDTERYLAGKNIWLDTSMGFSYFSQEQFLRIAEKHGTDKILFASDSPWSDAREEICRIRALPLAEEQINAVLGGNAAALLGL